MPVVVVNSPRAPDAAPNGRVAALQTALDGERTARVSAEQSLAGAQATIQSLQTKLAHAELAHNEALAAERRARAQAEAALRDAAAARELAEQQARETTAAQAPTPRATFKKAAPTKPRVAAAKTRESQPVKWWLPSYKAKTKER